MKNLLHLLFKMYLIKILKTSQEFLWSPEWVQMILSVGAQGPEFLWTHASTWSWGLWCSRYDEGAYLQAPSKGYMRRSRGALQWPWIIKTWARYRGSFPISRSPRTSSQRRISQKQAGNYANTKRYEQMNTCWKTPEANSVLKQISC